MICLNSEQLAPASTSTFSGSRQDFVGALGTLGAKIESRVSMAETSRPRRLLLICSYLDWIKVFGQAKIVANQRDERGCPSFFAWEYQCNDGTVLCLGCSRRRFDNEREIAIKAMYFS